MASVGNNGACVGALEIASLAAGFETADAIVKEASVDILMADCVSPGKYVLLFTGPVDDVSSALRRGIEVCGDVLLDRLFIPNIDGSLLAFARGEGVPPPFLDAVGIIETLSVASTLRAGDRAAKIASIQFVSAALARGLGGKSYVTFTGEVSDVEAAVDAGASDAEDAGMLVRRVIIPRPHRGMLEVLTA